MRERIDRLNKIGFPLAVFSLKDRNPRTKVKVGRRIIAKIPKA
jgi:hypothetical protein